MSIIYSYPEQGVLNANDMLIGTSAEKVGGKQKNITRNFSIQQIADFVNGGTGIIDPVATDFQIAVFNQGGTKLTGSIMSQNAFPNGSEITITGNLITTGSITTPANLTATGNVSLGGGINVVNLNSRTNLYGLVGDSTGTLGSNNQILISDNAGALVWDDYAAGLTYQGVWNAATNTPTLVSGTGTNGHFYIVDVAGNTNLNSNTDWQVGDWALFSGVTGAGGFWDKIDNTQSLTGSGTANTMTMWTSDSAIGNSLVSQAGTVVSVDGSLKVKDTVEATTANTNLKLKGAGTGGVEVMGDTTTQTDGKIQLNCYVNSHGVTIQSPPHSDSATYTLILPANVGNANQVLTSAGAGAGAQLTWSTPAAIDTYDLSAGAKSGTSVPLNLTSGSGTDDSAVNLTEGTGITLTQTSATEITIAGTAQGITGSGTATKLPKFATSTSLDDSIISQSTSGGYPGNGLLLIDNNPGQPLGAMLFSGPTSYPASTPINLATISAADRNRIRFEFDQTAAGIIQADAFRTAIGWPAAGVTTTATAIGPFTIAFNNGASIIITQPAGALQTNTNTVGASTIPVVEIGNNPAATGNNPTYGTGSGTVTPYSSWPTQPPAGTGNYGNAAGSVNGIQIAGELDMTTNQIKNVVNPTDAQDAATKNYVDSTPIGVTTFTNINGEFISAATVNTAAVGAVTTGVIDLSAVDGTSDSTTRFLSKDNTWDVPSYTTNTDTTYNLSAGVLGSNSIPLKLDASIGTDSAVNLTGGTGITLARTSGTEITITGSAQGVTSVTGDSTTIAATAGNTPVISAITAPGIALGNANLATGGQIQSAINTALSGAITFKGTFDASTGTITGGTDKLYNPGANSNTIAVAIGDMYVASVAGNFFGNASTPLSVGDEVIATVASTISPSVSVESNYSAVPSSGGAFLPLSGGTLTGGLTGTSATFSGVLTVGNSGTSRFTDTSAFPLQLNRGLDVDSAGANGAILGIGTLKAGTYKDGIRIIGALKTNGTDGNFALQTLGGNVYSDALAIDENQQLKFNAYGAGTLVSDGAGNITSSAGGGEGGPYLPLSGGTLTGNLTGTSVTFTGVVSLDGTNQIYFVPQAGESNNEAMRIVRSSDTMFFTYGINAPDTAFSFNSLGNMNFAKSVGIGTGVPHAKLDVRALTASSITNDRQTTTAGLVINGSNENMSLQLGVGGSSLNYGNWIQSSFDNGAPGSSPLYLNPIGGTVGIGTDTTVSTWLSGFDPATGNGNFKLTSEGWIVTPYLTGLASYVSGQGARPIIWADNTGTVIQNWDNDAADGVSIRSSDKTTRLFVREDGTVGIGTTGTYSSSQDLNLSGKGVSFKNNISGSNNNWSYIHNTDTGSSSNLAFSTGNSASALVISHTGLMKFSAYGAGTLVSDANGNITASASGGGLPTKTVVNLTGANNPTLNLTVTPSNKNYVDLYVDGVYQNKNTFSVTGAILTLDSSAVFPTGVLVEAVITT